MNDQIFFQETEEKLKEELVIIRGTITSVLKEIGTLKREIEQGLVDVRAARTAIAGKEKFFDELRKRREEIQQRIRMNDVERLAK